MDKITKFLTVVLFLVAVSFFNIQAEAAKSKLKGTLYAADITAKTLTIKNKSNALIVLNISSDTKIKRNRSLPL